MIKVGENYEEYKRWAKSGNICRIYGQKTDFWFWACNFVQILILFLGASSPPFKFFNFVYEKENKLIKGGP